MGDVDAKRAQLIISSQLNPPQYDLLELPRLNKSKIGFNWAGGAGRGSGVFYQIVMLIGFCLFVRKQKELLNQADRLF